MMKFLRTQMKWIMAIIVVAFLLSTFLMYEGRSTRRTPGRNPDGSMSDYEVAQINGRSLMRSELEQRLRNYLNTYSTRSMASIDMPAIYRAVLDQAILEAQLAKEVEEKGIRVTDAEADQAMKAYADRYYPTREAFYQVLANSGIRQEDYKRNLARQMAAERLIQEAIGQVTVSEDAALKFYDTMKNIIYSRPEGWNIHMADFNKKEDAEAFRARIAGGENWDVLASGDSLASMDVINITKSPVFLPSSSFSFGTLSVLASLDVGKVSDVFEMSSADYAVALKTAHVDASVTPYVEVSNDIHSLLNQQEERNRLTAYEASLRQKANVVINDEELFASPVVSQDNTPSADIVPDILINEVSRDEPAYQMTLEEVSTDEEPEVSEDIAIIGSDEPEVPEVPDDPDLEETPSVIVIEETSEDTPAVVEIETVSEEVSPEVQDEPEAPAVVEPETEPTSQEATPEAQDEPEPEAPAVVEPETEPTSQEVTPEVQEETEPEAPAVVEPETEATSQEVTPEAQDEPEPEAPAVEPETEATSQEVTPEVQDEPEPEAPAVVEPETEPVSQEVIPETTTEISADQQ